MRATHRKVWSRLTLLLKMVSAFCSAVGQDLLKEKKTVVMIAHTLSIVKNADQILVVSGGKIAEAGTHDELLAKGGKYAAMWNAEQKLSA